MIVNHTQHFLSVFSEGVQSIVILHFHPCSPSSAWDTQEKRRELWVGCVQVGEEGLCHLQLPGLDTAVCQKTKRGSFQGYHLTGAAWEEITRRRAKDETLLVTPLSLYPRQEAAGRIPNYSQISFVLKRSFFVPSSPPHFLHPYYPYGDKSVLGMKACCRWVTLQDVPWVRDSEVKKMHGTVKHPNMEKKCLKGVLMHQKSSEHAMDFFPSQMWQMFALQAKWIWGKANTANTPF